MVVISLLMFLSIAIKARHFQYQLGNKSSVITAEMSLSMAKHARMSQSNITNTMLVYFDVRRLGQSECAQQNQRENEKLYIEG